ncbi:hypothetical protein LEAN103870_06375 [Legionella anisa]|uniref:Bile acid beta-glucosidase n=1 Tax=Legionella anisa TaxID=28082 RepID=A0AAX0WQ33_9GAMM|nr:hypothetical protein [Legionella anisa]AWN75553.1 hypothetical protein DLD14_17875 [Legionella anisa]KTC76341.1 hypothetical protein Lani_0414 [Legionella anisa]MBN5935955.1 hypothetical protein [Legionella anisa]MCW8424255.1 hypothetical protein [Legionella anisa]MCW8446627.1 hypothetical protein [Legionella anisa]
MLNKFEKLIDSFEKKWDSEIVPTYENLKQRMSHSRVLSKQEAREIINELTTHYYLFFTTVTNTFAPYQKQLNETQQLKLKEFLDEIENSYQTDVNEFKNIYNQKLALLRNYFFQKEAARLPLPTVEEQYLTGQIFPSDPPEAYPQYYTYDFK